MDSFNGVSFVFHFKKNKSLIDFGMGNLYFAEGSHDVATESHYIELNAKIERISRIIDFLMMKLMFPAFIVPAVIITLVNYFIYDLKGESYFIPFSVW